MAGTVKVNGVQIGDDGTDTRNFYLRTLVDGTLKLGRGAAGAIADLMAFDSNGKVSFTSGFGAGNTNQSCIRLNTANGYGSTNTKIRRFTTTALSQGTDITYADSATLGASFTINVSGIYSISYSDCFNAPAVLGISLNSAQLTTNMDGISVADVLIANTTGAASYVGVSTWVGYLPSGSVVRPHSAGTAVGSVTNSIQFTITRVS